MIETASVLRAWARRGELGDDRARGALADLADFPARRWPCEPLFPRVWQLRHHVTAHDATYVALAELLDATLLTADRRLAEAVSRHADCPVITPDARTDRP